MSDLTIIARFELLPNEMLIECFEYFNATDIFYSFDGLNYRFNELIRIVPFHLNFQYIRKSIFDQFCIKMLLNPEIQKQIYSLELSNKETCHQIDVFCSLFSLDQFSNLQSLTMNKLTYQNMENLQSIFPLIPKLSSFYSIDYEYELPAILISKLRRLSVRYLYPYLNNIHQTLSIINLTIWKCSLTELYKLFSRTPMLKYLHVENLCIFSERYIFINNDQDSNSYCARNLQKLIFKNFQGKFVDFKMFVKQTPNLKSLTIYSKDETMIDAYQWQHLITTSLPYLNTFNFKFVSLIKKNDQIIIQKFKQFQTHFWEDQHHWYTEYLSNRDSVYIYTIPYVSNTYIVTLYTNNYLKKLNDHFKKFNNVTNLIFYQNAIKEKCRFYFSNVESLTLEGESKSSKYSEDCFLYKEYLQSIKMIINLTNLKHLNISSKLNCDILSLLLEIFKQSPQLSSLTIVPSVLSILFNNDQLWKYLNKMIRKFDIYQKEDSTLNQFGMINNFCQVFSNIEQLKCNIHQFEYLVFLINNLPKLTFFNGIIILTNEHFIQQFKDQLSNMNILYEITYHHLDQTRYTAEISIWMG